MKVNMQKGTSQSKHSRSLIQYVTLLLTYNIDMLRSEMNLVTLLLSCM